MFWQRLGDRAARMGHWKWVASRKGTGLFDLASDIGERTDVSQQHPQVLEEITSAFANWQAQMLAAEPRGPFRDF